MLESSKYKDNCFLTLTFADNFLPPNGVNTRDIQLFMKRLRKYISKNYIGKKIKYIACGEYGEKLMRPHYHLLIFNFNFPDMKFFKQTRKGENIYTSKILSSLWSYGHASIGTLTHASASYVAGYVHKKFFNKDEDKVIKHYTNLFGEVVNREFVTCSNGIAKDFVLNNIKQLINQDYIVYNGKKFPLPEAFNRWIEKMDVDAYSNMQAHRRLHVKEYTKEERKAKDLILKRKFSKR